MTRLSVPSAPPDRVVRPRVSRADAIVTGTFVGLAVVGAAVSALAHVQGLVGLGLAAAGLSVVCGLMAVVAASAVVTRAPERHYVTRCGRVRPWTQVRWRHGIPCCRACAACGTQQEEQGCD